MTTPYLRHNKNRRPPSVRPAGDIWRVGRVVEGSGLLIRRAATLREFESLTLRNPFVGDASRATIAQGIIADCAAMAKRNRRLTLSDRLCESIWQPGKTGTLSYGVTVTHHPLEVALPVRIRVAQQGSDPHVVSLIEGSFNQRKR